MSDAVEDFENPQWSGEPDRLPFEAFSDVSDHELSERGRGCVIVRARQVVDAPPPSAVAVQDGDEEGGGIGSDEIFACEKDGVDRDFGSTGELRASGGPAEE